LRKGLDRKRAKADVGSIKSRRGEKRKRSTSKKKRADKSAHGNGENPKNPRGKSSRGGGDAMDGGAE